MRRKDIQMKILEVYEEAISIYNKIWSMEESELKKVHKKINERLDKLKNEIIDLYNKILKTYSKEKYPRMYPALRGFFLNVLFDERLLKNRKFWKYDFPIKGKLPRPHRKIVYSVHPFYGRTVFEAMRFVISFIDAIDTDKRSWIQIGILRVTISRPNVTYYFYVVKDWNKELRVKHVPSEYEPSEGRNKGDYSYASQLRSVIFLATAGFRIQPTDFPYRYIRDPTSSWGRRRDIDFSDIPVIREEVVDNERRFIIDFSKIEKLPNELDLTKIKKVFEEKGYEVNWVSEWWA